MPLPIPMNSEPRETREKEAAHARDFKRIPARALCLGGGEVALGDNGDGSKTAPVRIKARSGNPIDHWYFGRVVHDLAGMRLHKSRLPIDYAHDENQVLGFLNHFDTESGNLIVSGALTPFQDDDRASEVMHKMRAGVPYEASIFFGGDGLVFDEVPEGETRMVNGAAFAGPGVVVKSWPLRGVAICPYGADANTETSALAADATFAGFTVKEIEEMDKIKELEAGLTEAKAAEAKAVEALAVEVKRAEEEKAALIGQIGERDAKIAQLAGDIAGLAKQADAAGAEVTALIAARDELAARADQYARAVDALEKRLAAIEAGAAPVSAKPAETKDPARSAWEKAVAAGRKESK